MFLGDQCFPECPAGLVRTPLSQADSQTGTRSEGRGRGKEEIKQTLGSKRKGKKGGSERKKKWRQERIREDTYVEDGKGREGKKRERKEGEGKRREMVKVKEGKREHGEITK